MPGGCVERLARCPRIALRRSPALPAWDDGAGHNEGEKCGLGLRRAAAAGSIPAMRRLILLIVLLFAGAALALGLVAWVVLIFVITIVKMKGG